MVYAVSPTDATAAILGTETTSRSGSDPAQIPARSSVSSAVPSPALTSRLTPRIADDDHAAWPGRFDDPGGGALLLIPVLLEIVLLICFLL